jgi:restriction system protein
MAAKMALHDHASARAAQADAMTAAVERQIQEISEILVGAARKNFAVDFSKLKSKPKNIPFDSAGLDMPKTKPEESTFLPESLNFLQRLIPVIVQKHEQAVTDGKACYDQATKEYCEGEERREQALEKAKAEHETLVDAERQRVAAINASIDSNEADYRARVPEAVVEYFSMVFEDDAMFEDRSPNVRVAYVADSSQLVVEYEFPLVEMVPPESGYKYVKKSDSIEPIPRKLPEIRKIYKETLAQVVCRVLRATISADVGNAVAVVVVNGFVDTTDPGTGNRITPTIISVSASTKELREINFGKVEAIPCLLNLKALVSRNAHELEPVRPIVNFNMVDPRFVDKGDVLTELDSRPNIAELTPSEFEMLMTNLFEKMGLETRLTQASRDGGVDCVAWDMRPVIGGKVVIQAKRYKNTVGVSAVRDLFGTMHNEGAAKGILVTTSGFGPSTYEFAKNKPIELITGSNLLSMLSEYAGVKAKIEFPQEWQDKGNLEELN